MISYHVTLILPYIGQKPLESIHTGTFEAFIDKRIKEDDVTPTTANRTMEVVRTILLRAARVWRGEDGKPWLSTAPMIEMLEENGRLPYPISWAEQKALFGELPAHLERPCLFSVNCGARDENVVGLRWEWEHRIPELERSVFIIPPDEFKSKRPHVLILNDVAMSVVNSCRGQHDTYVFTYTDVKKGLPPDRMLTLNGRAYRKARKRAKLQQVRIHDLRHTYGQRLRDAGVSEEDRAVLLGHATTSMPSHYATPTIERLVELANLVQKTRDTPTLLRVANGDSESRAKSRAEKKTA